MRVSRTFFVSARFAAVSFAAVRFVSVFFAVLFLTEAEVFSAITYSTDTSFSSAPNWNDDVIINTGVKVTLVNNILTGQTQDVAVNIGGTLSMSNTNTGANASNNSLCVGNNRSLTFTGSGTFLKEGAGILSTASGSYKNTAGISVKFAFSDGALMDVKGGTFCNGSYANQNWAENYADLRLGSGTTYDTWDGTNSQFDALIGAGTITNGTAKARTVTLGAANSTWLVNNVQTTPEFSGNIKSSTNGGTISITKTGNGTQIFTGNYTASGTLAVSGGILQIGKGDANGYVATSVALSMTSGAVLNYNSTRAVELTAASGSSGGTVNVLKGEFSVSGTASAADSPAFTAAAGARLGVLGAAWEEKVTAASGSVILMNVNPSAAGAYTAANFTEYRANNHFGEGVEIGVFTAKEQNVSQDISGDFLSTNTTFWKGGTGTFAFTGANTDFTAGITVSNGTLSLGNGTQTGSFSPNVAITVEKDGFFSYNNGAGTVTTLSNLVSGAGTLVVASGTLRVDSTSPTVPWSYTTTANDGTVTVTTLNSRLNTSNIAVKNGAVLLFDGVTGVQGQPVTLNIEKGGVVQYNMTAVHGSGSGESVGTSLTSTTVNGVLTITGSGTLLKTGDYYLHTVGGGNYSMVMSMTSGGLIDIQSGDFSNGGYYSQNWSANKGSVRIAEGARLNLWDGSDVYIDGLSGKGDVMRGTKMFVLGTDNHASFTNQTALFEGDIYGGSVHNPNTNAASGIRIVKRGTGTQILAGTNKYTGTTSVEAGTLQFGNGGDSGTIGTGDVSVSATATLAFNTSAENTMQKLSGKGNLRVAGSGKVTVNSALKLLEGGITVQDADSVVKFTVADGVSDAYTGSVSGNGTLEIASGPTSSVDFHNAPVADGVTIKYGGGKICASPVSFAGTLSVSGDTELTFSVGNPWQMTLYTDGANKNGLNGRIAPTTDASKITKTTIFTDKVYDMRQCANNSSAAEVAANWMAENYSAMSYTNIVRVLEDVKLDFSGAFDDTQGVWVLACDENGTALDGASWRQLLGYSGNCAVNTASNVNLSAGYYLMDVRVADQSGNRYAMGSVKDAAGLNLGVGMRESGAANYSAFDVNFMTGFLTASDKIMTVTPEGQVWNGNFDVADGTTLTVDNNHALVTKFTLNSTVTGTGTLALTNSAGSGKETAFVVNLDSAGSLTTADGLNLTLTGTLGKDLTIGKNSTLTVSADVTDTDPVVTVGGIAVLGDGTEMNIFLTGAAPEDGKTQNITLFKTPSDSNLQGFENAVLHLFPEDPNYRVQGEILNGSYVLTFGSAATLPEPSAWLLFLLGTGLCLYRKMRRQEFFRGSRA